MAASIIQQKLKHPYRASKRTTFKQGHQDGRWRRHVDKWQTRMRCDPYAYVSGQETLASYSIIKRMQFFEKMIRSTASIVSNRRGLDVRWDDLAWSPPHHEIFWAIKAWLHIKIFQCCWGRWTPKRRAWLCLSMPGRLTDVLGSVSHR